MVLMNSVQNQKSKEKCKTGAEQTVTSKKFRGTPLKSDWSRQPCAFCRICNDSYNRTGTVSKLFNEIL